MKVKILKATEQTDWYADRVEDEFEVIEIYDDRKKGTWTVNDGDNNKRLLKRDCEVVK